MRVRLPRVERVLPRLRAIDDAGIHANLGPQEQELRERFAALLGVAAGQVVTTSSATTALAGAAVVAGAAAWTMPSFTFTATPAALLGLAKRVTFADVADDWWLDRGPIAADARGLVPVAPFGAAPLAVDWPTDRPVVIDAAASLGTVPDLSGLPAGWTVVFSLHATKVLGIGEGGIAVLGDAEAADHLRSWTNFGLAGSRASERLGTNAKLTEVAAAYAHAALDAWDEERAEWLAARTLVERIARELDLVGRPGDVGGVHPYWIVLLPDAATAVTVEGVLAEHGVGTRRWWAGGCHRMPAYADVPHGPLPRTEDLADRSLGLPMFRGMTEDDADRVAEALSAARTRAGTW